MKTVEKDLLLHICCAPCLASVHEELDEMGIEFQGLWYNPNIQPYREYKKRRKALREYAQKRPVEIIYQDHYDLRGFLTGAIEIEKAGGLRCELCYKVRLEFTAREAKELGFKRFSTTLLFSKHQRHELIKEAAEEIATQVEIDFFYHDFRPGAKRSWEICKELDVYMQNYCGCIFSEEERFNPSCHPKD